MVEEEKQYENILCEFFNRTHSRMPKPKEFNLIGELAKKYSNPVEAEVSQENGGEWMSVKIRLPEFEKDVLCYDGDKNKIIIARFTKGIHLSHCEIADKWFREGFGNYGNQRGIIKWMALPKP